MTFSYHETKDLMDFVLKTSGANARTLLHERLKNMKREEPEFCMSVIQHGQRLIYTSEQWADFLFKVPNILFEHESWLMNKLSEKQRRKLGLE